jgi:hypothetical protein
MKDKIPVREERIRESRDQNRIDSYKNQKTENFFVLKIPNSRPGTFLHLQPSIFNKIHLGIKFKILRPNDPRVPFVAVEAGEKRTRYSNRFSGRDRRQGTSNGAALPRPLGPEGDPGARYVAPIFVVGGRAVSPSGLGM